MKGTETATHLDGLPEETKPRRKRLSVKRDTRVVHAHVPVHLYDTLLRLSADTQLSITAIIRQYLEYLQRQHWAKRKALGRDDDLKEFDLNEPDFD